MFVYLIGYALLFIGALLWLITTPKIRFIYILGLLYIAFIVIFRGNVGTDTGTYETIISRISLNNWLNQPTEFGFNLSAALLNLSGWSSDIVLRIFTAIFIVLVIWTLITAKKNIRQLLIIFFIPATIFIFSMNALRIGIAAYFLILALNYFQKNKIVSSLLFIFALSFHITVLLVLPLLFLFQKKNKYKFPITILIIIGLTIFLAINYSHIESKIALYMNYNSPNPLSGLSNIIVFFLLLPFLFSYPVSRHYKYLFSLSLFLLIAISYGIAQFSYAGLRLLQLYTLLSPIIFLFISNIRYGPQKISKKESSFLFIASLINTLFILRNFMDSYGHEFGFLPYTLIFN